MREIITLQIGQCGNRVGQKVGQINLIKFISNFCSASGGAVKFWEVISDEHGVGLDGFITTSQDPPQMQRISVYYNEMYDGRYVPRAVFTDLETGTLDAIQSETFTPFFNTNNFIASVLGAANNFAKGFYVGGPELTEPIVEIVRNEVENTDSLQGFQFIHSLGGGSGSGFGSLLMTKMKEEYPSCIINNYSVIPSTKVSDVVVEPYNSLLSLRHLLDQSDGTYCLDNEALFNICYNVLRQDVPFYSDLNHLISVSVSGITTSFRFPSEVNSDMRKLAVNMIPFPKLHFFIPGFAPLTTRSDITRHITISVKELTKGMFNPNNMFVINDPRANRHLTVAFIFRGMLSVKEVEEQMSQVQERYKSYFVPWLSNNLQLAICDVPSKGLNQSATIILNSTGVLDIFRRLLKQFSVMFKRKAFIHWYTSEGMEEAEFNDAQNSINELIDEYDLHQGS